MNQLLNLNGVTKYYGNGEAVSKALNGIDFRMSQGEFTAIMGASGSGKSTLLNIIATIDRPSAGSVMINGQDIGKMKEKKLAVFRRDQLGFIFQEYNLLDTLTIEENIMLPLNLQKKSLRDSQELLMEVAESLGITDQLKKFPNQLSGGQRQRAACARALITKPSLILADEPTGALDSMNSNALMETLVMMNQELGSTILMVTHDAMVGAYASRVLFLRDGKIWGELYKGKRTHQAMYSEILGTMSIMGGTAHVS